MAKSTTNLNQTTTNDAHEIDDAKLEAICGGWRPHRVYVPRACSNGAMGRGSSSDDDS